MLVFGLKSPSTTPPGVLGPRVGGVLSGLRRAPNSVFHALPHAEQLIVQPTALLRGAEAASETAKTALKDTRPIAKANAHRAAQGAREHLNSDNNSNPPLWSRARAAAVTARPTRSR